MNLGRDNPGAGALPTDSNTRYLFLDPTARTGEAVALCINPFGERKSCRPTLAILLLLMLLAFGIFRTAMFAEPAVTKIEEVCSLMHRSY